MLSVLLNIIKIAFLLGFLVFIHEGGHFLVAKLFKIKVNEFSIGFGPVIWEKQGKETLYELRAIPLGGFVNLLGEEDEVKEEGSYSEARKIKKILVLLAGGTVNIIFGIVVYFGLVVFSGNFVSTTIDQTIEGYAANIAGLQSGDKILKINDKKIRLKSQIDDAINQSEGNSIIFTVSRNDEIMDLEVTPTIAENMQTGNKYYLGVMFDIAPNSITNKIYYGFWDTLDFSTSIVDNLKDMFKGNVKVEDLSGPVGISEVVVKTENSTQFIYILALVSLSLGVTNLLPFPPLDGGKVLLVVIEAIIRKPIKDNVNEAIQMAGFVFIMGLTLFVTYNDIIKLF